MIGKQRVSTREIATYVEVAKCAVERCDDEEKLPALIEAHDIFEELLNWRRMHEKRQGDEGPVV